MQFKTSLVTAILATLSSTTLAADCPCHRNEDAGRWKDTNHSPAGVVGFLVDQGGGCFRGNGQGNLCVGMQNPTDHLRKCLKDYAKEQESYHRDWFLWTSISCSSGGAKGQISMTL
ncbi:hypothetical protein B0T14DRAFT_417286 [Immersiella caudata]|uniref:Uncharacterized protein n=1 Tax=Immersiella caudata TaxID=314043 RepID=A0AA39XHW1_9PEZI|nr:hypothetical protein B0T14DRAFT_417286 [Immersiella caudata]